MAHTRMFRKKSKGLSFLYVTRRLDPIQTPIKMHGDIPVGYKVMARTRMFGKNNQIRITWPLKRGDNHYCARHIALTYRKNFKNWDTKTNYRSCRQYKTV